jgi:trk system potassium uptake protein TrkA
LKIKGAKLYVVTKNDFCVIGLTKFGISVVEKLLFLNKNVLVIDVDPNKIAQISSTVQAAIILDPTNKDGLEQVGVKDSQNVIIAIDNDLATSIICTEIIKSFGIPNLIVKSINSHHEMILKALNVKNIVNTELEAAEKVLLKLV